MNDAVVRLQVQLDSGSAEKKVKTLSQKAEGLSNKMMNIGKKTTLGLTAPITGLVAAGVKYNAEMEKYGANLQTLLGGNKKAADAMLQDLKEMANTTPFETTDLVKATQTMLGFGIEANKSQKYLKQLGDISMGDKEKLSGLTLAFSQVQSTGKLMGQDLLQMINQGFNPLNIISEKTGESMASLKDRMSKGALSADEVSQALQWATEKGGLFYKSMDKASQTTEGRMSTMKDELKTAVGSLTESLLPVFESIVGKITALAQWFSGLSTGAKKAILVILGVVAAVGPLLMIISSLIKILTVLKSVMVVINVVLAANPIGIIIMAIAAVIAILVLLWTKCEGFRNGVIAIITTIWSWIKAYVGFFINIYKKIWEVIKAGLNKIKSGFSNALSFVKTIITKYVMFYVNIFKRIWTGVKWVIDKIKYGFSYMAGKIKGVFSGLASGILGIMSRVTGAIKTPINWAIGGINKLIRGANKLPGVNIPTIPALATGTNYVQQEGLAYLHKGEAVVPKKYNPALGGGNGSPNITVIANMDVDKFGKAFVKDIKTFAGGSKNSYNYGGAR